MLPTLQTWEGRRVCSIDSDYQRDGVLLSLEGGERVFLTRHTFAELQGWPRMVGAPPPLPPPPRLPAPPERRVQSRAKEAFLPKVSWSLRAARLGAALTLTPA